MSYPIDMMSERQLRAEADRLKQLLDTNEATCDDALRLADVRVSLKIIERVRAGNSPLSP
jgi:hypothetical protein